MGTDGERRGGKEGRKGQTTRREVAKSRTKKEAKSRKGRHKREERNSKSRDEEEGEMKGGVATHHMQHVCNGTLAVPVLGTEGIVCTRPIGY